jgi:gamma-glutamylcyclotransferase (GGCT)/AIG2-like uncharacterized protein YtfP
MMSTSRLFVYGTLRRDATGKMNALLEPEWAFVGEGSVSGLLFRVGPHRALMVSAEGEPVAGEIYAIDPERFDEAMRKLDAYEGISESSDAQDYRREIAAVKMKSGESIDAWVYTLNRSTEGLSRIV